jgi:peroxiredoxin
LQKEKGLCRIFYLHPTIQILTRPLKTCIIAGKKEIKMPVHADDIHLGSNAHPFNLPGTDGRNYQLNDFSDARLLVILFICNHCPYVKAIQDRLVALQGEYDKKDVSLVAISSNDVATYPEDSFDNMKKVVAEKGYNFPYLFDETQEVAKTYDAVCTPDIFVYDDERKLAYRGRLDDNWKEPEKVTHRDLKLALDSLLKGEEITFNIVPSMGCSIKWKN